MNNTRQIGIRMTLEAASLQSGLPAITRQVDQFGTTAQRAGERGSRGVSQVSFSLTELIKVGGGLTAVSSAIRGIGDAITSLPRAGFDFSKELEVSRLGMAGVLGSMTAMNGQQTSFNQGLAIASDMIGKLNDDALRTAATSQELTSVFQALLAPGLSARMTLDEIRELTVVGTNAVKSIGLGQQQAVQELRDLVAGGIQPASSTLANALGLRDSDITRAKESSDGLFRFLMEKLKGFEASAEAFGSTTKGQFDQLQEGATRVAAEGMQPLTAAIKAAAGEAAQLFFTMGEGGKVQLNQTLIADLRAVSAAAVDGMQVTRSLVAFTWEHRDAVIALGAAYVSVRSGQAVAEMASLVKAKLDATAASRLLAAQSAAEALGNQQVVVSSRAKLAAYMAELQAAVATAQAEQAAQVAKLAHLQAGLEGIAMSRAEVVAKMEANRTTILQAEAQLVASRAAGALSFALAAQRQATEALSAAQARQAMLVTELAALGRQQAGVQAAITAATNAQKVATDGLAAAQGRQAAAQAATSLGARALGGVLGVLGGPLGAVTTALTLGATAWMIWGNRSSSSSRQAAQAVASSGEQIRAELTDQITLLERRNLAMQAGFPTTGNDAQAAEGGRLLAEIQRLQSTRGETVGQELARQAQLQKALTEYGQLVGAVNRQEQLRSAGVQQLTLTLNGSEQAWRKSIDDAKTSIAAQREYDQKVQASRKSLQQYIDQLKASGASEDGVARKTAAARKEQAQAEAAWREEMNKGKGKDKGDPYTAQRDAAQEWMDVMKDAMKVQREAEAGMDGLTRGQERLVEYLLSPAYAINSEEMRQLAVQTLVAAINTEQLAEAKEREKRWQEEASSENAASIERRQQQAAAAEDELRQQREFNERIGLSTQQVARLDAAKLRETATSLRWRAETIQGAKAQDDSADAMRRQADALDRLASERVKGADQTRAHEANMELWRNVDEAGREVWRSMAEGGENAFERVLKTARGMWNDFIYEVAMRPILMNIAASLGLPGASSYLQNSNAGGGILGNLVNGFVNGGFSGAQAAFSQTALGSSGFGTGLAYGNLDLGMFFAKGGVPGLSEFSGQVVNRPTMFQFAKGSGVMGEAGAEGIFPLRRGPDGRLGIEAHGGGGATNNYYGGDVIVQVEGQVDYRTRSQMATDAAFAQRSAQRFD